jgi:hypothetical protein
MEGIYPITLRFPPETRLAVVAGQWCLVAGEWIEATFASAWELWLCLGVVGLDVQQPRLGEADLPEWWKEYAPPSQVRVGLEDLPDFLAGLRARGADWRLAWPEGAAMPEIVVVGSRE